MKKNLSYREKLIELSKIYRVLEIQNYIKNKKNLTTSQLEHILRKNRIAIPSDLNTNFVKRNFFKPLTKAGSQTTSFFNNLENSIFNFFKNLWKNVGRAGLGILNLLPKLIGEFLIFIRFIKESLVAFFYNLYDSKLEDKKINKVISFVGSAIIIFTVGILGFTVFTNLDDNKKGENKIVKDFKKIESKDKIKEKKVVKKQKEKKIITKKDKKEPKENKVAKKTQKNPSQLKELVLPDLNLKTKTVLNLFADVKYDLKTVRNKKVVKPIYFTQFPKDLDEIKDVQLKKETFIKIILPLVVAENKKILDDRLKLKQIARKNKKLSEKDQRWLKQKYREYKIKKSDINELQKRMDVIPVSIAIAQAAKESGWGTSRFALEGNAIFGQWTWTGKGIEPLNKGKQENHKILRFPILRASVKAYKNNLNTHKGYSEFREKRFALRKKNRPLDGFNLTGSLDNYAQTGKEYTLIIKKIILQNNLKDFETVKLTTTVEKKQINL